MKIASKKASLLNSTRWKRVDIKECNPSTSACGGDRLDVDGPSAVSIYVTHADEDVAKGGYPSLTVLEFDLTDVAAAERCVLALNALIARARRGVGALKG